MFSPLQCYAFLFHYAKETNSCAFMLVRIRFKKRKNSIKAASERTTNTLKCKRKQNSHLREICGLCRYANDSKIFHVVYRHRSNNALDSVRNHKTKHERRIPHKEKCDVKQITAGVKCMLQSNVSKCVANSVLKIERNTWFGNMQMPNHKTECQYNSKVNATNSHSHAREFILSLAVNRTARNIDKSRSIQCFFSGSHK